MEEGSLHGTDKKRCLDALAPEIIAYLDKLAERGSLLKVGALDADPKYKWIWGQCASLWRNHRVKTGIEKEGYGARKACDQLDP